MFRPPPPPDAGPARAPDDADDDGRRGGADEARLVGELREAARARVAGAAAILLQPCTAEEVVGAIEGVLGTGSDAGP